MLEFMLALGSHFKGVYYSQLTSDEYSVLDLVLALRGHLADILPGVLVLGQSDEERGSGLGSAVVDVDLDPAVADHNRLVHRKDLLALIAGGDLLPHQDKVF